MGFHTRWQPGRIRSSSYGFFDFDIIFFLSVKIQITFNFNIEETETLSTKSVHLMAPLENHMIYRWKVSFYLPLTDAGENGTFWPLYFGLGAESYSSLGPVGKKEKKVAWDILAKFACGQVSSPRLHRLRFRKAGRLWCGGAPETHWVTCTMKWLIAKWNSLSDLPDFLGHYDSSIKKYGVNAFFKIKTLNELKCFW